MQAQVLGLSVDSVPCLTAWAASLGGISFPLLSDFYPHGAVAESYGLLRPDGRTERTVIVIDKEGIVRYVDVHDIDSQPDNDEIFAVLAKLEPALAAKQAAADAARSPAESDAEVVLYCTPWCPSCGRAKQFLEAKGVQPLEVDISRDRDAAAKVRSWANGNETTPTFNVRGTIVVGLDLVKLQEALGQ